MKKWAVFQFRVCILRKTHLKANYVTMTCEGCGSSKAPPDAAFFPCLVTATILHSLPYPKILCAPEKEKRERGGDITRCRSSLSLAWASGDATRKWLKARSTVDVAFEGLTKGLVFEGRKGRVLRRMQTLNHISLTGMLDVCRWFPLSINVMRYFDYKLDDLPANKELDK